MATLVVTLTWNRRETSLRWIPELAKHAGCDYRHVIVDNGSTDGTADALEEAGYEVVASPVNLGVALGWQTGYEHAIATGFEPDIVCRVDDDCEPLTDNILAQVVQFLDDVGHNCCVAPTNVTLANNPRYAPKVLDTSTVLAGHQIQMVNHAGLFVGVPRDAFDDMISTGGIRDGDTARGKYWRRIGYPTFYLRDVEVAHRGRGTGPGSGYRL